MSERRGVAVLGGPASGKTTYMGAIVRALEGQKVAHLELRSLPDDATAYGRLSGPLGKLQYPQRTKAERHNLELPLRAKRGEQSEDISLLMGDYDGEEVERLFKDRNQGYSEEWKARAHARGMLLFLRPNALTPLPRLKIHENLSDRDRLLALKSTPKPTGRSQVPKKEQANPEDIFGPGIQDEQYRPRVAAPNDAVQVPTVLAVIELLQFLRHERGLGSGERPKLGDLRIALLASAWDSVDGTWQRKGPKEFFLEQAPLLTEFLWSNHRAEDVMFFGLSSTAGDLHDSEYKKIYRRKPHGYIEWSDATGRILRSNNIALPIEWALFGDEAFTRCEAEVRYS